jgi:predicted transcriptional regulator
MVEGVPVDEKAKILGMTAQIAAAYFSKNAVAATDISGVIREIQQALSGLASGEPKKTLNPAVAVKKSIHPDYIVCLEDGKKLKMLKRYIMKRYGLTPDAYRTKWALPADYPMVAPNYAKKRSAMAVKLGLGRKKKSA